MANLIDTTYFYGDLAIGQVSTAAVASSLTLFIDKKEAELLRKLLGYELYKALKAWNGTDAGRINDLCDGKEYTNRAGLLTKWNGLKFTDGTGGKKSPIANYVYYYWLRNEVSATAGVSEVQGDVQNGVVVSSAHKQARAWNEMVEWNCELVEFLLANQSDYADFYNHLVLSNELSQVTRPINTMNL